MITQEITITGKRGEGKSKKLAEYVAVELLKNKIAKGLFIGDDESYRKFKELLSVLGASFNDLCRLVPSNQLTEENVDIFDADNTFIVCNKMNKEANLVENLRVLDLLGLVSAYYAALINEYNNLDIECQSE